MTSDAGGGPTIQWRKLVADGLVIVASILLAFAIDAWWDTFRDASNARSRLVLLSEQNVANHDGLARANQRLATADSAMVVLIQTIGPRPGMLAQDSLAWLLTASFAYGDFDVELSAADEILAAGQLDTETWRTLYDRLSEFRAATGYFQDDFERLLERREDAAAYLVANGSLGSLLSPAIGDTTPFSFPAHRLLVDRRLEGLLLVLHVRAATVRRRCQYLLNVSDSIRVLLDQMAS